MPVSNSVLSSVGSTAWSRLVEECSRWEPINGAGRRMVMADGDHFRVRCGSMPDPVAQCRLSRAERSVPPAARGIFAALTWHVIPGRVVLTRMPSRMAAGPARGRSIDRQAREGGRMPALAGSALPVGSVPPGYGWEDRCARDDDFGRLKFRKYRYCGPLRSAPTSESSDISALPADPLRVCRTTADTNASAAFMTR